MDRIIDISMGPEVVTELLSYEKVDEVLSLHCDLWIKQVAYTVKFELNCLDNSLKTSFLSERKSEKKIVESAKPYFYMQLSSDCKKCGGISHSGTSPIELDINHGKLLNIGLEHESIYFLQPKDKYHVTFEYKKNMMYITRCVLEPDGSILDENSIFKFPIINLDLTNQEKCVNKIKTILIFS